jgi:hypothetical protein
MRCVTSADEGINGPTWSPDGESLAMADLEGIWVKRDAGNCGSPAPQLILPGGSYPDWGPAPVNPGPREPQLGLQTPGPVPPVSPPASPRGAGGKCAAGSKAQRAKCLAATRRAQALRKCRRKHGKAHARCVRAAKKNAGKK